VDVNLLYQIPMIINLMVHAKGVQPGDKICFANGTRTGHLLFTNINGTAANPVIITNMCDGEVFFNAPANWGNCVTFQNSKHYRFTGSANPNVFLRHEKLVVPLWDSKLRILAHEFRN
jgi:hypothetical protein